MAAVQKGQTLEAEISGVNSDGDGIARVGRDGFVVFVRGALPGETARCRVTRAASRHAAADAVEILSAAEVRRPPRCRHYGRCGGCRIQHASYGAQLAIKSKILSDALRRAAHIDAGAIECVPSPSEWAYRNKTSLPAQSLPPSRINKKGRPFVCGYFEQGSHRIVPYGECPVLEPSLGSLVPALIRALSDARLRGYDEKSGSGDIRYVVARSGGEGGAEALACAVAARPLSKRETGRLREIFMGLGCAGASINYNTDPGNFIWGSRFSHLTGKKFIEQRLGEYSFETDISSFFQINRPQAAALFSHVRELARRVGAADVLELCAGAGSLTAYLSGAADRITAVEEWRPAVRLMASNMERNGARNVTPWEGSAEDFFAGADAPRPGQYGLIVADPPRTGLAESVIDGMARAKPEAMIYVSCSPATLARDISRLAERGYELAEIKAFDMFPQTAHVESVALMRRTEA